MQENIVQYLKEKYSPKILILHGSRASGKNRENSDWDLVVFTEDGVTEGAATEAFEDQMLDVDIVNLPINKDEFVDDYGRNLHSAIVLLDNENNLGSELIEASKKYYAMGRKLSDKEYSNRKNYMGRLINRLSGTVEDPALFFLHLGFFYEKALQYWFETKGRFSKPVYNAIEDIKKEDEKYYKLLETIFLPQFSSQTKLDSAQKIQSIIFQK